MKKLFFIAYLVFISTLTIAIEYKAETIENKGDNTIRENEIQVKTNTWIGTVDFNWDNPLNWSENVVPNSSCDVVIQEGAVKLLPTTKASCRNISIASLASLTIESDELSSGSLIVSGTSSGEILYNRFVKGGKWHTISSPVSNQNIDNFLASNTSIPSMGTQRGMMSYNSSTNTWSDFYEASTSGKLETCKGYSVQTTVDTTLNFKGQITSGSVDFKVETLGQGWNCIGNPYTSAININNDASAMSNFLKMNAIDNQNIDPCFAAIYVWDEQSSYDGTRNDYYVISNSGYTDPKRLAGQNHVQVGQGFFVKAIAPIVHFSPTIRTHQPSVTLKSTELSWPGVELIAVAKDKKSSTILTFNENMTLDVDVTFDAGMLKTDPTFSLYSRMINSNGVDFALQCLPDYQMENLVVPIGLDYPEGGEITFTANNTNITSLGNPILEDRLMNTFTQLSDQNASYTTLALRRSRGIGRFYLHFSMPMATSNQVSSIKPSITASVVENSIQINGKVSKMGIAKIYDKLGRTLETHKLLDGTNNRIVTSLTQGVYIMTIVDGSNIYSTKLLLKP